ncbi:hypothetical protein BPNPMPFG_008202 (plasmid) [Mesorhizobium sp. AR07]|nr:hypothetical protein BPNPMPFG_008202 [Mesorhizobium sp. AR07]
MSCQHGGAAPPPGPAHRYIFTVHALKVEKLDLDADASAALVGFMVHMNTLGKAEIAFERLLDDVGAHFVGGFGDLLGVPARNLDFLECAVEGLQARERLIEFRSHDADLGDVADAQVEPRARPDPDGGDSLGLCDALLDDPECQ